MTTTIVGNGKYTYEMNEDLGTCPGRLGYAGCGGGRGLPGQGLRL